MPHYWYIDLDTVFKLVLAVALGGAIGFERERHGRDAGFRTHIIVCLASTLMLISSNCIAALIHDDTGTLRIDPGRVSAGIITGIGFLGAGTIIRTHDAVRGLTTAACLWFVAGIGIVIGVGHYTLATLGTLLGLFVLYTLGRLEKHIVPDAYVNLSVEGRSTEAIVEGLQKVLPDFGMKMKNYSVREDCEAGTCTVSALLKYKRQMIAAAVVAKVREIPGVKNISWERYLT